MAVATSLMKIRCTFNWAEATAMCGPMSMSIVACSRPNESLLLEATWITTYLVRLLESMWITTYLGHLAWTIKREKWGRGMGNVRKRARERRRKCMTCSFSLSLYTHTHTETQAESERETWVGTSWKNLLISILTLKLCTQQFATVIGKSKANSRQKWKGWTRLWCIQMYV